MIVELEIARLVESLGTDFDRLHTPRTKRPNPAAFTGDGVPNARFGDEAQQIN